MAKKKIRDRKEFFLGKIAGREDVDVNTLMPPGASSTEEELLLEIAGRIDGIETNGGSGGSGEGGGAGLPSVEGSGKVLVSVNGEFVEQDGYGYNVLGESEIYNSNENVITEYNADSGDVPAFVDAGSAYVLFEISSDPDDYFTSDDYKFKLANYGSRCNLDTGILEGEYYYNVTLNGTKYENIPLKQLVVDGGSEFGMTPFYGYIGADFLMEDLLTLDINNDFSEYPFSIVIPSDGDEFLPTTLVTKDSIAPTFSLIIEEISEITTPIDSKYIDIDASDIIKSNTVSIYQRASNNKNFEELLEEWRTNVINEQLDDLYLLEEKISAFNIFYMDEKYDDDGQFIGRECLKCVSIYFNYSDTDTADMGTVQFVFQRFDGESLSPIRLIYVMNEEEGFASFYDPDEWVPM